MNAGQPLDALIATKVMGWSPLEPGRTDAWTDTSGKIRSWENTSFESFRPSTDIRAAWEVVDQILKRGEYAFSLLSRDGAPGWRVELQRQIDDVSGFEAETAPHAICLAALKARGIEF